MPVVRSPFDLAGARARRQPLGRARAGADAEIAPLVDELCRSSPEFAALWRDNNVQTDGDGVKHLRHPELGSITLEYSAFAVDGRPDLSLIVYNPATPADQKLIESLVRRQPPPARQRDDRLVDAA